MCPGFTGSTWGGGVNAYFIEDHSGCITLIDTGLPWSTERMLAGLSALGRTVSDVAVIVVTHADIDHIGGLSRLAAATGARVSAGRKTIAYIKNRTVPPHIGFPHIIPVLAISRFRGPTPTRIEEIEDCVQLPARGGLRAVATPGHTEDHFSFFLEDESVLFCGDIYRPSINMKPFKRNEWSSTENDSSHEKLMRLKAAIVCPGHGDCVRF